MYFGTYKIFPEDPPLLSRMEVCLSFVLAQPPKFDWDAYKRFDVTLLMKQQWRKAHPVNSK